MKTALIIIDMQNGFINENTKELVPKIVNLAKNGNFDKVIGTRYINNQNTACYIYEHFDNCFAETKSCNLVSEIEEVCDIIFDKNTYSCWNDNFKNILKKYNIDKLVFVGVNTGCCVLASAFAAYDDVFNINVIKDLCGSSSGVDSHNAGIKILKECITKERVITTEQYLKKTKGILI